MSPMRNLQLMEDGPEELDYRPRALRRSPGFHNGELEQLLAEGAAVFVHDTLIDQLSDWIATQSPAQELTADELSNRVRAHLKGQAPSEYGTWFYYPWSRRLVHVLPEPEFHSLRTNRNQYKISPEGQRALAAKRIGVVGLSVGQSAALSMALEGVGGSFRLADFDRLGLSNLNRLRAGVHELGLNKAVVAARQMVELDPYLDISLFPEGLAEESLDRFFLEGGRLDLLVEECDDLALKLRLREKARELGVPVLMETSDRGLLDVERFDLEADRPLLHGLLGGVETAALSRQGAKEKLPVVLRLLGGSQLSAAALASMVEIKQTISTWPQLASGVALGGAVVCDAARRILLDEFRASGRFYVDLQALVRDGAGQPTPAPPPWVPATSPEALAERAGLELPPLAAGPVRPEEIRYLVSHGLLAPSGGNSQPWRFRFAGGRLFCGLDPGRAESFLDHDQSAAYLALGAAVENIDLAAQRLGLTMGVRASSGAEKELWACALSFERTGAPASPPLFEQVLLRATNRKRGTRHPIAPADYGALRSAVSDPDVRLQLLVGPAQLDAIGQVLGEGDRLRFLHQALHREMMGELRWTGEEAARSRDGIDLATLELSASEAAALSVVASWPAMAKLRQLGGGSGLAESALAATRLASAVGLLTLRGAGPMGALRGGRALQRLWLTATRQGLAFQPHSALPYLFSRLERGGGDGFSDQERKELRALRRRYRALFDVGADECELLLFRVGYADPPTARSLRRPVDEVLTIER